MLNILSLANYGFISVFGILLSVHFAGVKMKQKNRLPILCIIILLLLIQAVSWHFLGYETTKKIYPFIIHIPLAISIAFYYKRSLTIAIVSVISSYLCCQIPHWFATFALHLSDNMLVYYIINTLSIFPVYYLLKKYVVFSVYNLLNTSKRSLLLFSIVPTMYYVFDYTTTIYTNMLYQGIAVAVTFMPSVLSMLYFVFIIIYYNEMQRRSYAEKQNMLLSVQLKQSARDLDAFWDSQHKAAIYRHDMRHHLNLIAGFLSAGEFQNATEYITRAQSDIDEITPIRYCDNNTINLILSHFAGKAKAIDAIFSVDVQIPQSIPITETELCALLSNGLENAINACKQVAADKLRSVHINCKLHKGNLLLLIENSYTGELMAENGLPVSKEKEHGFGIRSMVMIIDKYKGYFTYAAKDELFTLRIVLPLEKEDYSTSI